MNISLVLPGPLIEDLAEKARLSDESGGVLLARHHHADNGDIRLLGRSMHWVPPSAYLHRSSHAMSIASEGYVKALGAAERDGAVPIWLHTHPNGPPLPSERDRQVDAAIADVFRLRSGSPFYGTVIVSPDGANGNHAGRLRFTGTLGKDGASVEAIHRFWLVGDRWWLVPGADQPPCGLVGDMFDRSVRAFGEGVQRAIGALRIGIVGAGGTGSAVAEQLVRLGARDILLVDADTLSESNVTRVYGSTTTRVGEHKTTVLARHLRSIAPGLRCTTVQGLCTSEPVARSLANVDIIFGCTDDNAGRLVLSRLSIYHLVPLIDVGVLLSSDEHELLTGIDGRVTIVSPGNACLICRGRVDTARAAAEMQTPQERKRLVDEGYAPALGPVEPAVVTFTTGVAAAAVNELLERLVGYGHPERPSEVLLRIHDREISTNVAKPGQHHYCHAARGKWGLGDTEPFLEQTWVA